MKNMYKSSFNMNASDLYKEALSSIRSEQFSFGNRDGAGQPKKVHQKIKQEVLHELNFFENVHKNLLTLEEKLKKNDETERLAKELAIRKNLWLYTINNIYILKPKARHSRNQVSDCTTIYLKKILGINATGIVVRKMNNFKKIFLYAITIRYPFRKTFPLPYAP